MTDQDTTTRWETIKRSFLRSWSQVREQVRTRWERLSEDDIQEIEGHLGRLTDKISQRYGVAQDEAERQIREWVSSDVPWLQRVRTVPSLRWTIIFLLAALVSALIGFTPVTEFVKFLFRVAFYISAVGFVVFLVINLTMRRGP